jgi:inorganic pyrophosphatase
MIPHPELAEEIAHFFVAYRRREDHDITVPGWASREDAEAVICEARERFSTGAP